MPLPCCVGLPFPVGARKWAAHFRRRDPTAQRSEQGWSGHSTAPSSQQAERGPGHRKESPAPTEEQWKDLAHPLHCWSEASGSFPVLALSCR